MHNKESKSELVRKKEVLPNLRETEQRMKGESCESMHFADKSHSALCSHSATHFLFSESQEEDFDEMILR